MLIYFLRATHAVPISFACYARSSISPLRATHAPKPYHPAAVAFINHSLDHWAGGEGKWTQRFMHHDKHHIERDLAKGKVIERHKKEVQRLPSSYYDVSAL